MARNTFGGGPSDYVLNTTSGTWRNAGPALCTAWSAELGGAQLTDLLVDGQAATGVRIGSTGRIPAFQGPNGVEELWLSVPGIPGRARLTRYGAQGGPGPAGPPGGKGDKGDMGDVTPAATSARDAALSAAEAAAVDRQAAQTARVASEAARNQAQTARTAAETARDQTTQIAGIPSEDAAVEYLVKQQTSKARVAMEGVFVARDSVYLRDYVKASNTPAQNREAWVAAGQEAVASGKRRLCYDGAFFTFEGAEVVSGSADVVHWASSWDTHKITQLTKGRGALALVGGAGQVASQLNVDGNNPELDLSGVTVGGAGQFRYSVGVRIGPDAHYSRLSEIQATGFMHATVVSSISPESLTGAAPLPTEQLKGCEVDGINNLGCWTALQHIAPLGLSIRRLRGWFQDVTGSGGEGHQIYGGGYLGGGLDWWAEQVTIDDCDTSRGVAHGLTDTAAAYKITRHRDLTISNLRAMNSPGLLSMERVQNFSVGTGIAGFRDIGTGIAPALQFLECSNGVVAPMVLESIAQLGVGQALMVIASCTDVEIERPRITVNAAGGGTAVSAAVMVIRGANPGVRIVEPRIVNRGVNVATAILTNEMSGSTGSTSGVDVVLPEIVGSFTVGTRAALKGGTFRLDPTRVSAAATASVDTGMTGVTLENRLSPLTPYRQPRTVGWHNGETLSGPAPGARTWPSGQQHAYAQGNGWTGNGRGRVTVGDNGGARSMIATFDRPDIELSASVLLGVGSTQAGFALRAVSATDHLIVARVAGGVIIAKKVGSTTTTLKSATTTVADGVFANLRVVIVGTTVTAYLDGLTQPLAHTLAGGDETTFVSGAHGFFGHVAPTAIWENTLARSVV